MRSIKLNFWLVALLVSWLSSSAWAVDAYLVHDPLNAEGKVERFEPGMQVQGCGTALPNRELDLFDVVNFTLCNSLATKNSWNTALSAAYAKATAQADYYLPTLSSTISVPAFQYRVGGDGVSRLEDSGRSSATFTMSYTLFDFGIKENTKRIAELAFQNANYDYDLSLQDAIGSIVGLYFNYQVARDTLAASKRNLASAREAFNAANLQYEIGQRPLSDKLNAELTVNEAERSLIKAESDLALSKANLAVRMGLSAYTPLSIAPYTVQDFGPDFDRTVEEVVQLAKENRLEFKQRIVELEMLRLTETNKRRDWLPSVSVNMSAGVANANPFSERNYSGAAASVNFNIPFNTSIGRVNGRRQSELGFDNAVNSYEDNVRQFELNVWTDYQNYLDQRRNYALADDRLRNAKLSRDITLARYREGLSSILDTLSAEASFQQAENTYLNEKYRFVGSRVTMLRSLGFLNLDAIKPISAAGLSPASGKPLVEEEVRP
jgi:outer membrane protein